MNIVTRFIRSFLLMADILGYWIGLHDKSICMDNVQHLGLHYNLHSLYGHTMSLVTHETLKVSWPRLHFALFEALWCHIK